MSEQISPSQQDHKTFLRLVRVDALLFTSTAAVVVITLLSTLARRSRNPIVKALITVLSTLYIPLVTYTLAATEYVQAPSPLLIVSAVLLQLIVRKTSGEKLKIYIRSNNNNDENANNIDRGDDFNPTQHLADAGWLGFLFISYQNEALQHDYHTIYSDLLLPATIVLAINVFNVIQTSLAKKLANRSFAVGRNANLVAGYMAELPNQHGGEVVADYEQSPSRFMSDYPYLVLGEEKLKRVITQDGYRLITTNNVDNNKYITLDKIWRCERNLLRHNEKNREVCLSFALFKLLRLRFEGMQQSESNSERALNLVINGPFRDHRRAFRLVEMELAFLDDYLYSELPFTYHGWFVLVNILQCLCFLSFCCYISWRVVQRLIEHDSYLNYYYHDVLGPDLNLREPTISILLYFDAIVCLIIVFTAGCVEAIKVLTYLFSGQAKVVLLCKYAMKKPYTRQAIKAIELLTPKKIISYLRKKKIILKEKQLSQYSICSEKETSIDLPDEVKKAVIDSLVQHHGIQPAPDYQYMANVPGAVEAGNLASYTERILVWHVATSHCEDHQPVAEPAIQSVNRKVASILSRYCAYLVASAPELLPDGAAWNGFIVKGVREIAQSELRGWGTWRITKLVGITRKVLHMEDEGRPSERPAQVHTEGKELGRQLLEMIEDEEELWQALATLWAEMLLSMAPSDDLNAHAESIAKGVSSSPMSGPCSPMLGSTSTVPCQTAFDFGLVCFSLLGRLI